jgi:hypothetical protein
LRPFSLISIIFILFTSCSTPTTNKVQSVIIASDTLVLADTTVEQINLALTDTCSVPTKKFLNMVSILDSAGLIADTNRIKKVPYYFRSIKNSSVFTVKQIPFYKIDVTQNPIFHYINYTNDSNYPNEDFIRKVLKLKNAIYKVEKITGFYFQEKTNSSFATDGFLEEWEFRNSLDAKMVETTLIESTNSIPIYYNIYINSFVHFFRKENYFYSFHSRADWDAKRLDKIYNQIIKKTDADSWTKSFYK